MEGKIALSAVEMPRVQFFARVSAAKIPLMVSHLSVTMVKTINHPTTMMVMLPSKGNHVLPLGSNQ